MNNIEKDTNNKNQSHQYEIKIPINIPHKNHLTSNIKNN